MKINAGEKKNIHPDLVVRNQASLQDKVLSHQTEKLIDILMRAEQSKELISGELLKEQQRKKKKGKRPGGLH